MKRTTKPGAKKNKVQVEVKAVEQVAPTTVVKQTRISHLKLGPALLARKASDAEVQKAFTDSFNARGKTDQDWINGRIKIYMNIARKAAQKAAKADAKAKTA